MKKIKVVISLGDPAGCGPYITVKSLQKIELSGTEFFVVGDIKVMENIRCFRALSKRRDITFIDTETEGIEKLVVGKSSLLGGIAALNYLTTALKLVRKICAECLVTSPVSKEAIGLVEKGFTGHTEFLAQFFKVNNFAMMMFSTKLKVVLITRHIRLKDVKESINEQIVLDTLILTNSFLREKLRIRKPRIVFCSVNPHAGVETFLEDEEKIILNAIRRSGLRDVYGPFPADTVFIPEKLAMYDCVVTAYHDQAMIPFKLLSFRQGVNVTLGLPIIRTSPSHGVAYDLVREGRRPFCSSMEEAVRLAVRLARG